MFICLGCERNIRSPAVDTQQKHMPGVLQKAHAHQGAAFVEIYTNCIVYNDAVFSSFAEKATAAEGTLVLENGLPMIFGKDNDKGIRMKSGALKLEVVQLGLNGISESDILVHDETDRVMAGMLADMCNPDFPVAVGVLYCEPALTYDDAVYEQINAAAVANDQADINSLLRSGSTWNVV